MRTPGATTWLAGLSHWTAITPDDGPRMRRALGHPVIGPRARALMQEANRFRKSFRSLPAGQRELMEDRTLSTLRNQFSRFVGFGAETREAYVKSPEAYDAVYHLVDLALCNGHRKTLKALGMLGSRSTA